MAQFTVYKSTDSGAPTLSGTAGDLINVLDKVLVNGYGSKSPAGWSKNYAATNQAAYRMGRGPMMYFRVEDNASAGAPREAQIQGFESMSSITTGVNPFGSIGASGVCVLKSSTANSTTRPWRIYADAGTVIMLTQFDSSFWSGIYFGEFYSFRKGDPYRCIIKGRTQVNFINQNGEGLVQFQAIGAGSSPVGATVKARNSRGTFWPRTCGCHGDTAKGSSSKNLGSVTYKNAPDNAIALSKVFIHETEGDGGNHVVGTLRGYYHFLHAWTTPADGDTFSAQSTGWAGISGRTFELSKPSGEAGGSDCGHCIETSNTLDTNDD